MNSASSVSIPLAERDPGQVVLAKAVLGATATALLAVVFGESLPSPGAALGLLAVGATGYGLSLRFYLLAQRAFGAARTGSVFAFAPFIGAALAVAMGNQSISWMMVAASALMLSGGHCQVKFEKAKKWEFFRNTCDLNGIQ